MWRCHKHIKRSTLYGISTIHHASKCVKKHMTKCLYLQRLQECILSVTRTDTLYLVMFDPSVKYSLGTGYYPAFVSPLPLFELNVKSRPHTDTGGLRDFTIFILCIMTYLISAGFCLSFKYSRYLLH